jgi:hypothetical protein
MWPGEYRHRNASVAVRFVFLDLPPLRLGIGKVEQLNLAHRRSPA